MRVGICGGGRVAVGRPCHSEESSTKNLSGDDCPREPWSGERFFALRSAGAALRLRMTLYGRPWRPSANVTIAEAFPLNVSMALAGTQRPHYKWIALGIAATSTMLGTSD